MPEGDTIFRAARALNRALAGRTVEAFETGYAHLASANDDNPAVGRTVERVEARGKWLLLFFSGDLILVTHMLMSGSWHIYRTGEKWQRGRPDMRVMLRATGLGESGSDMSFEAVGFNIPVAEFHTAKSLARHRAIPRLGPDVLNASFDADAAAARIAAYPKEEIGNVLLNQQVLAGLGNVFKSEICFACKIHPFRATKTLTADELACLTFTAKKFLSANVIDTAPGNIVTYTGLRRTTGSHDDQARLWVYRRRGYGCRRCGTEIVMRKQGSGARSTFWCPQCQPYLDAFRRPASFAY